MSLLTRPGTPRDGVPAGTGPPPVAMRDLRVLTWVPVGAMAGLVLWSVVAPARVQAAALVLAVAGAAVGLPHGAVDHLVPWWWGRGGALAERSRGRIMAAFILG